MASPVDTTVKFYRGDFPGAPTLNGVAGSMIGVLDECGITGFGSRTATALVVSGGVATLTLASDSENPNLLHSVVAVDGVTGAMTDLNGEQRVTGATLTALQFPTALADGTATGTITVKTAPFGMTKEFTDTNKAVYKFSAPEAAGLVLRVDDTGTTTARVVGYETMSSVDTGAKPFPTAAQYDGGLYWPKSGVADSSVRGWALYSDGRSILPVMFPSATLATNGSIFGFGDLVSAKSGDAFGVFMSGGASTVATTTTPDSGQLSYGDFTSASGRLFVARSHTFLGTSVSAMKTSALNTAGALSGRSGYSGHGVVYPNGPDNGLYLSPVEVICAGAVRGRIPGMYHTPQDVGNGSTLGQIVEGQGVHSGKRFVALRVGAPGADVYGYAFIDITGPWRD